jgi:hypothetical protein
MAQRKTSVEDELDGLYAGDFDDFVARRNEVAKRLRDQGDREAADRVRALKKPSRGAWAINRVSADEPKLRDALLEAGAALRKAQEKVVAGSGDRAELREAGEREKAAVGNALDAAGAVSEEAGARLSPAALERVSKTLHAVALDEDVRKDFERHRLTTEHEAAGMGGLSPVGGAPARKRDADKRRRDELKAAEAEAERLDARRLDAEREAEEAREAAEGAQRELKRASRELGKVTSAAKAARKRADDLRERTT